VHSARGEQRFGALLSLETDGPGPDGTSRPVAAAHKQCILKQRGCSGQHMTTTAERLVGSFSCELEFNSHEIHVRGELDGDSATRLLEAVEMMALPGDADVTIDVGGVTRIGMAGVEAILQAWCLVAETSHDFYLVRVPESVRRMFDHADLRYLLPIFP
jgi:anti-anti-sigma factor